MNKPTQLTIEHIAAYLPYGVKVKSIDIFIGDPVFTLAAETISGTHAGMNWVLSDSFKLVLRPLSQLTEQITHNGDTFTPLERLNHVTMMNGKLQLRGEVEGFHPDPVFEDYRFLHSLHFDTFGLIEAGLAVSMNPDGTIAQ